MPEAATRRIARQRIRMDGLGFSWGISKRNGASFSEQKL
jgi:hypothetical protein